LNLRKRRDYFQSISRWKFKEPKRTQTELKIGVLSKLLFESSFLEDNSGEIFTVLSRFFSQRLQVCSSKSLFAIGSHLGISVGLKLSLTKNMIACFLTGNEVRLKLSVLYGI